MEPSPGPLRESEMTATPPLTRGNWPAPNPQRIEAVTDCGFGLADLWEESPHLRDSSEPQTDAIVTALFPGNPLLCCGWARHRFDTRQRKNWHKLESLQFIVPSPMRARTGRTKAGKLSAHTLDTTGPRRFLVVEFDSGTIDAQAGLLLHLAESAPLALAVHSGGKSLHGWFYCVGCDDETLDAFMRTAAELGADPATFSNPSQFVRMPDGVREDGKRQTVYFFNPEVA